MDAFIAAALTVALLAAYCDARTGLIPNWLTLPALGVGIIAHVGVGYAQGGIDAALQAGAFSLLGALVCGIVPVLLFVKRAIGGGDVKLLMAMGAMAMPMTGIEMELYGFVVAAGYAVVKIGLSGKLGAALRSSGKVLAGKLRAPATGDAGGAPGAAGELTWLRLGPSLFVGALLQTLPSWW